MTAITICECFNDRIKKLMHERDLLMAEVGNVAAAMNKST